MSTCAGRARARSKSSSPRGHRCPRPRWTPRRARRVALGDRGRRACRAAHLARRADPERCEPQRVPAGDRGCDEARATARELSEAGVDFLKTHRPRRGGVLRADRRGRELGLDVVGHIPMEIEPAEAVASGQATIEHTETSSKARGTRPDRALAAGGPALPRRGRRELSRGSSRTRPAHADAGHVGARARRGRRGVGGAFRVVPSSARCTRPDDVSPGRTSPPTVRRHHPAPRAGAAGPAGLSPAEALRAATIAPAQVLGVDDELGTVEPGKLADLVLLDAEPARGHLEHAPDRLRDRARARLRAAQPVSGLKFAFDVICQRVPFHV